jgi:hypothetical protein
MNWESREKEWVAIDGENVCTVRSRMMQGFVEMWFWEVNSNQISVFCDNYHSNPQDSMKACERFIAHMEGFTP